MMVKSANELEGRELFNIAMLVDSAARRWGERVAIYHYETGKTVSYREVAENALNRLASYSLPIEV